MGGARGGALNAILNIIYKIIHNTDTFSSKNNKQKQQQLNTTKPESVIV